MRAASGNSSIAGVIVALLIIAVDIGLARLGYGLLLPAVRADIGGAYGLYGAIGAVHLAGYLIGTILAACFLSNRAGLPRVMCGAQLVVGGGLFWSAFAHDVFSLGVTRCVVGIASGVAIIAVVTDALERVARSQRGVTSSIAFAGIGVGVMASAPAGQWAIADPARWREVTLVFAAAACIVALTALGLRAFIPAVESPAQTGIAFRARDLIGRRYLPFVVAYTCFGIAYISYATFAVAAFAARGISGATLSAVWFGFGFAAIVGALAMGRVLSGRWHRYALMLPLLGGAIGCALSLFESEVAAIAGAFAVGSCLSATPAVASAFGRERSDAATSAQALAAITACFGGGQIAGPLVTGALADVFGLKAVVSVGAGVFLIGALCAYVDANYVCGDARAKMA